MKSPLKSLSLPVTLLALTSAAHAQQAESSPTVVVVAGNPIGPTLLYILIGSILAILILMVVWLRSRRKGGGVIASSKK